MSLKFIALSGTTDVTENIYLYQYGNEIIVVDCGVGFPDSDLLGVDLVIPDFTYLKENAKKVKGILITHGHEDHLGALPFLPPEIKAPIYATSLTAGFIEDKFADYQIKGQKINVLDPEKESVSLGSFQVTPFRVSHSIPDAVGFCLDTPEGRIFHVSDYKFDWTPVNQKPFDIRKTALLASRGEILMLASDCLGATSPGYAGSELEIETRIENIARKAKGAIFFSTISSNISRMQQAINVASRLGRKVCFIGLSIQKKTEIARKLGHLNLGRNRIVPPKVAARMSANKLMYIISGSYGQPGSSLYRLALGEHQSLSLTENDVVIFSSDPAPPGSKSKVDFVVDRLIELGVEVHYYDLQEDLHVSGHGSQGDITMLFGLVQPKYFVPIGGTVRYMRAYAGLAKDMGFEEKNVFELLPGEMIEFKNGQAKRAGQISVKPVLVDGRDIGGVGKTVLRDRHVLAKEGVAMVLIQIEKGQRQLISDPEIISRGFVFEKDQKGILIKAAQELRRQIESQKVIKRETIHQTTIRFLERFFDQETGRFPMIIPVVVEI